MCFNRFNFHRQRPGNVTVGAESITKQGFAHSDARPQVW
jgi:hypothetical protein